MASVNKNDETLQEYKNTKNTLVNEAQANYNTVSSGAQEKYNELINATKDYGEKQAEITQNQTNQTIKEINQKKDQTEQDYIKEQKAGYVDYAKQVNDYGVNAEVQASAGLQGSGYSESSKLSAYNTYQNRYMTARETFNRAVLNYDNEIAKAQLQNSSLLAEIAFNSLQTQLQLALEGFQYQNELLNNLFNQKLNVSSTYDSLWQSQYNTLLGEAQFNEQMAYQRERDAIADAQWQAQYNLSRAKASSSGGGVADTQVTGGEAELPAGDSVLGISARLANTRPQSTDSVDGLLEMKQWEESVIQDVQSSGLPATEQAQVLKNLSIGLVDYDNLIASRSKTKTSRIGQTKSGSGGGKGK